MHTDQLTGQYAYWPRGRPVCILPGQYAYWPGGWSVCILTGQYAYWPSQHMGRNIYTGAGADVPTSYVRAGLTWNWSKIANQQPGQSLYKAMSYQFNELEWVPAWVCLLDIFTKQVNTFFEHFNFHQMPHNFFLALDNPILPQSPPSFFGCLYPL